MSQKVVTLESKHCFSARVVEVGGRLSLSEKGLSLSSTTENKVHTKAVKDLACENTTSHFQIQTVYYLQRKED